MKKINANQMKNIKRKQKEIILLFSHNNANNALKKNYM